MKSEILHAKDILMSCEMSIKAVNVIKKLVAITDEERILLENGSLRDMIKRDIDRRAHFEYEKKEIAIQDRIKNEQSIRCSSHQIKFRNQSNPKSITYVS